MEEDLPPLPPPAKALMILPKKPLVLPLALPQPPPPLEPPLLAAAAVAVTGPRIFLEYPVWEFVCVILLRSTTYVVPRVWRLTLVEPPLTAEVKRTCVV